MVPEELRVPEEDVLTSVFCPKNTIYLPVYGSTEDAMGEVAETEENIWVPS